MSVGSPRIALDVSGITFVEACRAKVCQGVIRYARERTSWKFLLNDANLSLYYKFENFEDLIAAGVDGIIFVAQNYDDIHRIARLNIPAVHVMSLINISELPSVQPDNIEIGRMGARHFIERGYRNLAFCGPANWHWSRLRAMSFQETARLAKCDCHLLLPPYSGGQNYRSEIEHIPETDWVTALDLQDWIKNLPKPVGIMGCHDQRAGHVLEACRVLNIKVPQEVAVIGVDNNELICESCYPPLKSIDRNYHE